MRQQSRIETEPLSMSAVRQHTMQANPWMMDSSDAGSMISDRDATYAHQYAQSAVNGYTSQVSQGGGSMNFPAPMRRSLSGTLSRGGGMTGGEVEMVQQQHSFKGPAHRTISRITNRNRMSMGSMSGGTMSGGTMISSSGSMYGGGMDKVDRGFVTGVASASQGNLMQRQGTLSRAMSVKSMQSVGRGMDIFNGQMEGSMGNLSGWEDHTHVLIWLFIWKSVPVVTSDWLDFIHLKNQSQCMWMLIDMRRAEDKSGDSLLTFWSTTNPKRNNNKLILLIRTVCVSKAWYTVVLSLASVRLHCTVLCPFITVNGHCSLFWVYPTYPAACSGAPNVNWSTAENSPKQMLLCSPVWEKFVKSTIWKWMSFIFKLYIFSRNRGVWSWEPQTGKWRQTVSRNS